MATETAEDLTTAAEPAEPTVPTRARFLQWAVWTWAALEAALLATAPLLFSEAITADTTGATVELALFLVATALAVMAFATAGLLVTRQQPRNAVGWVMLAGGPALGAVFVGYAIGVALVDGGSAAGAWFTLLGVVLFGPALFLLGPALASVFPDGRPLPGWWARALWLTAAAIAVGSVLAAVAPGQVEQGVDVPNPLGVAALPAGLRDVANAITGIALVAGALIGVTSLVVRYRRSAQDARHQLRWFLFAVGIWAAVLPISLVAGGDTNWPAIVALIGLTLVPAAVVVAIRRYRLYEIDVLINRTFVYVPLVGIVAGLYAGLLALLQRLFTAVTGDESDAAAVISALALAAVFTPMRNAIQAAVDRRFKPEEATTPTPYDDPEFRAAVEAIVREVVDARDAGRR